MITRTTGAIVAADLISEIDGTYGYSVESLQKMEGPPDPPADYDQRWQEVRDSAIEVDPAPEIGPWRETVGPAGPTKVAALYIRSWRGARIRGWLIRTPGSLRRGLVIGHGYSRRDAPDLAFPIGCLAIQLIARGMPGSELPGVGDTADTHVLSGIGDFLTYSHTGAAADQWAGTTTLRMLAPDVPIGYQGASFGGGIGVLAAAFEDRWDALQVTVPSFGHHPVRLGLRCCGSGEAVRRHAIARPEVREVLAYVDAATAATRVKLPTLCVAAAADPAVPPPGQFAIANSFAGPTWLHIQPGGHAEWATSVTDLRQSADHVTEFWTNPAEAVRLPGPSREPT